MIRTITETNNIDGTSIKEVYCLHADEKPTAGLATGSVCVEVDTGDAFLFNEVSSTWTKL